MGHVLCTPFGCLQSGSQARSLDQVQVVDVFDCQHLRLRVNPQCFVARFWVVVVTLHPLVVSLPVQGSHMINHKLRRNTNMQ